MSRIRPVVFFLAGFADFFTGFAQTFFGAAFFAGAACFAGLPAVLSAVALAAVEALAEVGAAAELRDAHDRLVDVLERPGGIHLRRP